MSATYQLAAAARRARFADIDAQIFTVSNPPHYLSDEQETLEKMDAYKYPVLTLPNEIVAEVFTHFLPVYPRRPPPFGLLSPTTLGQICQKWREIAFSTPSLWRAIALYLGQTERFESQLNLLETWMERSGSCPLSIAIATFSISHNELDRFTQAIIPQCERWEYLRIPTSLSRTHPTKTQMPLLRGLEIAANPRKGLNNPIPFLDASQLYNVHLGCYDNNLLPTIPWAQLTTLVLDAAAPHNCVVILNLTTNLVQCTLIFGRLFDIVGDPIADIKPLLHLESLVFATQSHFGLAPMGPGPDFISKLTLPALRKLHVPEEGLGPNPGTPLVSLISRSGCSLQELYITGFSQSGSFYRTVFPSVPKVAVNLQRNAPRRLRDEEAFYADLSESDSTSDSMQESDDDSDNGVW
jgi:hypothetical protein